MKKITFVFISIILLITLSCKKEETTKIKQLNPKVITDENCNITLKSLINNSNIKTSFKERMFSSIDNEENEKLTIKLFVKSLGGENNENTIGWIIIDLAKKELLDITNDIDEPVILKYKNTDWDNFIKCYKTPKTSKTMNTEKIQFTQLFNDGSNIEFSPTELSSDKAEIKEFKNRLELFLQDNELKNNFDNDNLLKSINNDTFFDSQHYTNSLWLEYFIEKFKININSLNELMILAVSQEDINAIKILLKKGYIVSLNELDKVNETKESVASKIEQDRNEPFESYLKNESKIKEIESLINREYLSNHIQDSDGYTNLREQKSKESVVLQKINNREKIEVLDNTGDWYLVKTKAGNQGYVFKTKIISE